MNGDSSPWHQFPYIWHKYYGATAIKQNLPTLISKPNYYNQVAIPDETALVNVVTSSSVHTATLPVAFVTTTPSTDSLNPQLTHSNPFNVQCVDSWNQLTQLGAQTIVSPAQLVKLSVISCSSVTRLSPIPKSRPRFHPMPVDNKKRKKQEESSSSSEDDKPAKKFRCQCYQRLHVWSSCLHVHH